MNMHKSKGKEFDAVVIVEGLHRDKLLDLDWDSRRITQQRRVLRVAITRARHEVVVVGPQNAVPLVPPNALICSSHHADRASRCALYDGL